jgi:hypothetical protein
MQNIVFAYARISEGCLNYAADSMQSKIFKKGRLR